MDQILSSIHTSMSINISLIQIPDILYFKHLSSKVSLDIKLFIPTPHEYVDFL